MRAAEQFAKRQVPVESHAQMASAAESSMSRTRRPLSLRASFACNHTGLTPEMGMLVPGTGKEETPDGAAFTGREHASSGYLTIHSVIFLRKSAKRFDRAAKQPAISNASPNSGDIPASFCF
jgi:hypothetical protein